jgi:pimeloyl-[acyl-carrier protein] synthase
MVCEPLDWSALALLPRPTDVLTRYRMHDPVHWGEPRVPGSSGCWYLTQYNDVVRTLRHAAVGHMRTCPYNRENVLNGSTFTIDHVLDRWFLFLDPPDHERLRSTVNKTLQSRARGLQPQIEQTARSMIAGLPNNGVVDLLSTYAYPLTVISMAEVLGVPSQDCARLISWASKLIQVLDKLSSISILEIHTAFAEFFAYIKSIIRDGDTADSTALGSLLRARNAAVISEDEVLATSALLLLGSAETIPTLIGNSILLLLQHPEQLALLRTSHDLIGSAINEVLRFESPVQFTRRRAIADFELGGKVIRRGDYIVVFYNSANRDPDIFEDPETFDITRAENPHLGFGSGIHNCVGARLGHLIAKVAVLELVTAAPRLALLDSPPTWRGHETIRGLQSLRVSF